MTANDNLRGMALMALAMAAFALADAFIKELASTLSRGEIIAITGLSGAAVFAVMLLARGERVITRDILTPPVALRIAAEGLGTYGIVTALALVPLSSVVSIMQSVPLLVTMGAVVILGETVGWRRWAAILVGLFGVLVILRPGFEGFSFAALFALLGAICLATRDLMTRLAPPSASSLQLGCWGFLGLVPAGVIPLIVNGEATGQYPFTAILLLASVTASTVLAIFSITLAMRTGDVAVVSPFRYTRLLFGLLIAMLWFGERPDLPTWIGAAIVAGSGIYTFYRERQSLKT